MRHRSSDWAGTGHRYDYITDEQAREWLLTNEYNNDEIARATGATVPEVSGPPVMGRPEIGPPVQVRFPAETLAAVDELAAAEGIPRAAWIRNAVKDAVQDASTLRA